MSRVADALDLTGRAIVVAGAGGGGIGTAICGWLAEAGASVVALDNRPEALAVVEAVLEKAGGNHLARVVDVRDRAAVDAAVAEAATLGRLHGSVHVAGGIWPPQWHALVDLDMALFDQVLDLNLRAALLVLHATASRLVALGQGGSIVNIASLVGLSAMPFGSAYAASKAALLSVTRTAALELGSARIRVNAVAPGTIRTPKSQQGRPAEESESAAELATLPLKRRGKPDDIAAAVLFLLSDMATYITGQVLPVDGGSSVLPSFVDAELLPVSVRDEAMRARFRDKG